MDDDNRNVGKEVVQDILNSGVEEIRDWGLGEPQINSGTPKI